MIGRDDIFQLGYGEQAFLHRVRSRIVVAPSL
jgi:hypothetical protein